MSASSSRYICAKCGAKYPSNQTLQKHLSDKKAHTKAKGGAQAPPAAPAATGGASAAGKARS